MAISLYFGLPGCGKTTMLAKLAADAIRKGMYEHVYTNVYLNLPGVTLIDNECIGKYSFFNRPLVLVFSNRLIRFREIRQRLQLPRIKILVIPGPIDPNGEEPNIPRRPGISLDNLAQFLAACFGIRDDNAVGDTVTLTDKLSGQEGFVNVIHAVRNDTNFSVNTIPLLGEQCNISIVMTMKQEELQFTFIKRLVRTGISKQSSFIDQKQAIAWRWRRTTRKFLKVSRKKSRKEKYARFFKRILFS